MYVRHAQLTAFLGFVLWFIFVGCCILTSSPILRNIFLKDFMPASSVRRIAIIKIIIRSDGIIRNECKKDLRQNKQTSKH